MTDQAPRLYTDLAAWWPLMSPPEDYVEEAADLWPTLVAATDRPPETLLELGSGGGSLAFHLKSRLRLTLTDRSPGMLAVSHAVNPECEHVVGDMRTLDLGRQFDLVLVHDAVMYATTPADLRATIATAVGHCRPGGAVVFLPDCVKETFEPYTDHGGLDGADGRALRYLEWTWDPDPGDDTAEMAFAFLLREADGEVRQVLDRHEFGLFPRESWLAWLGEAGCAVTSRVDSWRRDLFVGRRP
jgi:SAM-dependent methyltransferase